MKFLWLLPFFLVAGYGKYQQEDWIDPTDMLNYDAAAGRMKHQKPHHTEATEVNGNADGQAQGTCQSDSSDCKTDTSNWKQKDIIAAEEQNKMKDKSLVKECMERLDSLKKENEGLKMKECISQRNCNPVFKRFLHRILNEAQVLGLPDESQPEVHYDVELLLTKQMVAEFLRFLDDKDWNSGPLDEALGETLVKFKPHNEEEWSWKFEDYIGTDPFTAFMISLSVLCIVKVVATELWTKIGWFTQIKRLLPVSVLISIVWNWIYLYKDAFAEQQAKLAKMGDADACSKKISFSESIIAWWQSSSSFQNDPCEEYFKALVVNPILLVPPTKAFAVTFTNLITEPLKHIGKGLGEFFHGLLAEMPLFYQPIVLIIIAFLLLVFCYGFGSNFYRMNLLRRHDDRERGGLPPPREEYERFIEGRDSRHHHVQQIQPRHHEGHRDVVDRGPEVLQALDREDIHNDQEDSENDPSDQRHPSQQPTNELLEDSPLGSQGRWEESVKDSEPLDKISPVHQDFSGSHTVKVKENQLPDAETLVSTSHIAEEVKESKEPAEKQNEQKQMKESQPKILKENIPVDTVASAEHVGVQDTTTVYPVKSHLSDPDLNEEDLYTDPGNSQTVVYT